MQTGSCDNDHADQLSQRVALAEESIPPVGLLSKEFKLHYHWLLHSIRMVAKIMGALGLKIIMRHFIFLGVPKEDPDLASYPYSP